LTKQYVRRHTLDESGSAAFPATAMGRLNLAHTYFAVLVARCAASSEAGLDRMKAALVAQLEASGLAAPDFSGDNAGH
jgi:hypothetical protein